MNPPRSYVQLENDESLIRVTRLLPAAPRRPPRTLEHARTEGTTARIAPLSLLAAAEAMFVDGGVMDVVGHGRMPGEALALAFSEFRHECQPGAPSKPTPGARPVVGDRPFAMDHRAHPSGTTSLM